MPNNRSAAAFHRDNREPGEPRPAHGASEATEGWGAVSEDPPNAARLDELIALRLGDAGDNSAAREAERQRILAEEARIGQQLAVALAEQREQQRRSDDEAKAPARMA